MFLGIQAVIAKSYARIHHSNLINFGILPLQFANTEDYDRVEKGDHVIIKDLYKAITDNQTYIVENATKNLSFTVKSGFNDREKEIIKKGGLLPYTKEHQIS